MLWGGKMNRTIIINKMYAGKYLETGENIGHEIINLFQSDDGKYYIYLNSQGTIATKYINGAKIIHSKTTPQKKEVKPTRQIDVLLTRPINAHVLQVLALAENVSVLDSAILSSKKEYKEKFKKKTDRRETQKDMNITYDECQIDKILSKNKYKNITEQDIFATFRTGNLKKPRKPLFLCSIATDNNENEETVKQFQFIDGDYRIIETEKGFGKQSLRLYFTGKYDEEDKTGNKNTNKEENTESFKELSNIIDNPNYWTEKHDFDKVNISSFDFNETPTNFLSIIKEEDRELTFSNLLQHFLSDKVILKNFCDNVIDVDINTDNIDISVNREEHNVDLIIRDGTNIIVIENKILSGINGENKTVDEQLNKIFQIQDSEDNAEDTVDEVKKAQKEQKKKLKELRDTLKIDAEKHSELIVSQLSKYYFYARKIALEEGILEENIHLYIFCPNYQEKFYKKENRKKYLCGDKYEEPITYGEIQTFFKDNGNKNDFYLQEFIKAMDKHTKPNNNSKEDEMKLRFMKAIKKVKDEQNG